MSGIMTGERSRGAAWAAALLAVCAWLAPAAEAQTMCDNPAETCGRLVDSRCLEKLGAGAVASTPAGMNCTSQLATYRECLATVNENCASAGRPVGGGAGAVSPAPAPSPSGCSAEDARALWADLKSSPHPEDLEAFAEVCKDRPQARLALARAERLRAAAGAGGSAGAPAGGGRSEPWNGGGAGAGREPSPSPAPAPTPSADVPSTFILFEAERLLAGEAYRISTFVTWSQTPQGHLFWSNEQSRLAQGLPLTPEARGVVQGWIDAVRGR